MHDLNDGDIKRRVLKKFGRLLDVMSDISRSSRDTEFAEYNGVEPNKIYYVFDENVFELFINPKENSNFCTNFYGQGWDGGRKAKEYSAQAALVAGEYLFSGNLPGFGTDGQILLSEWHYYQLIRRLRKIRGDLRHGGEYEADAARIRRETEEAFARRDALDGLSIADMIKSIRSRELREDARIFAEFIPSKHKDQAETAVRRFVLAREQARLLANDERLEPLQQIDRIYKDILPNIELLSGRFRPEDDHEARLLRDWIALWVRVLGDEHITDRGEGVDSDARTVGYVHWVAQWKLKRTERIVLVTGDVRLFDAYRRWHSNRDPGEAFLLRRINQYSPLLNPHDALNEIANDGGEKPIFATLRSALDAPMLTFNLGRGLAQEGNLGQLDPRREYFAEFLIKEPRPEAHPITQFFTYNLDSDWWRTCEDSFNQLKLNWQAAERAAVGISFPAIEGRWAERQGTFALLAERAQDGDWSAVFSEYISSMLAKIAKDGLNSDVTHAIEIVRSQLQSRQAVNREARAPLRIQLRFPLPDGSTRPFAEILAEFEQGMEFRVRAAGSNEE